MIAKTYLPKITTLLCALFFITPLVSKDSDIISPLLLFVLALFFSKPSLHKNNWDLIKISISFLGYFFLVLLSFFFIGGELNQLDMPSRALLCVLILMLLVRYPPQAKYIFYSLPLGSVITGCIAILQYINFYSPQGVFRAFTNEGYMVIQAAGVCASLATLSLISFFYARKTNNKALQLLAFIGSSLAFLACILTGARGAWLITPFIVLWLLWSQRELLSKNLIMVGAITLTICVSIAAPQISSRINAVYTDLSQYNQENTKTSSGIRLELWKSSYYSFLEKPLFGHGFSGKLEKAKQRQIEKSLITPITLDFRRAHNQFLEDLQTKGLLGVIVLVAMFWIPFSVFKKHRHAAKLLKSDRIKIELYYIALMGQYHIILIIGYCLTQHYLNHHSGILFYLIGTVIFSSICLSKNSHNNTSSTGQNHSNSELL